MRVAAIWLALASLILLSCLTEGTQHRFGGGLRGDGFIRVDGIQLKDENDQTYFVNGINYWSCMNLAADESVGGDVDRLAHDLDSLKRANVNNVRIMAATEGAPDRQPFRIYPVLRESAWAWNEDLFVGLDRCIHEVGKRGMRVIVVLGNTWQWTGGLAQLRSWANNDTRIPYPRAWDINAAPQRTDGYTGWGSWVVPGNDDTPEDFMTFQAGFYSDQEARKLYMQHLDKVLHRINKISGKRYVDDPTILAWEPLNEPQTFNMCEQNDAMISWHHTVSTYIKRHAARQLVTTGFEAKQGERCFKQLHGHRSIDFSCAHIWAEIWGHYDMLDAGLSSLRKAKAFAEQYLAQIGRWSVEIGKPVLLEEFGMARDNWYNKRLPYVYHTNATTRHRDAYFGHLYDLISNNDAEQNPWIGLMPWSYGGSFKSDDQKANKFGMLFAGDPPQEPPGWFSVLEGDSTIALIRSWAKSEGSLDICTTYDILS